MYNFCLQSCLTPTLCAFFAFICAECLHLPDAFIIIIDNSSVDTANILAIVVIVTVLLYNNYVAFAVVLYATQFGKTANFAYRLILK